MRLLDVLRSPLWRAALVVLLLASIPLYVLSYTIGPETGTFGISRDVPFADAPGVREPVAVEQDSSAWRAGIRTGDTIVFDRNGAALLYPSPGERTTVHYIHAGSVRTARLIAARSTPGPVGLPDGVRSLVTAFLLTFALLVIVRAWRTEYGPLIATLLTADVVNPATDALPFFVVPGVSHTLYVINDLFAWTSGSVDVFLLFFLIDHLSGGSSKLVRLFDGLLATNSAVVAVTAPVIAALSFAGNAPLFVSPLWKTTYAAIPVITPVVGLPYAYAVARGEGRARIAWLFWGFFPFCLGVLLVNLPSLFPQTAPLLYADPQRAVIFSSVARALEISLPVSLFYGLLLRRAVDIGFVINRVAVYGLISVIVLAIFVLLEYLAGHFFLETGRAASLALQLGIALVIGLSARYLHGAIDRLVDSVLFAKRHHDEAALHRLAQEAEAFTSSTTLLDRALQTVCDHSEARGVAIYLCDEHAAKVVRASSDVFPAAVDIDDPLLVALRRWREPLDTHATKTAFPEGMGFPMVARAQVIGVLLCRTKRDSTAFAPDEREPLMEVATCVARAIDALAHERSDSIDTIQESIQALQGTMIAIEDAVIAVKEAVIGEAASQA